MSNRSYEVEYCNLELRFDRRRIQSLISELVEEGYSLYWNENDRYFIVSIRSGRKLVKLKFERQRDKYKLVGNYTLKDSKLAELMEKMIGDTRGHAVVKRFKEHQILIENIMFGEIIRTIEINGVKQKVLFEKVPAITADAVIKAFKSNRAEQRIPVLRMEMDYELLTLHDLIQENAPQEEIDRCKQNLEQLRREWLMLEC